MSKPGSVLSTTGSFKSVGSIKSSGSSATRLQKSTSRKRRSKNVYFFQLKIFSIKKLVINLLYIKIVSYENEKEEVNEENELVTDFLFTDEDLKVNIIKMPERSNLFVRLFHYMYDYIKLSMFFILQKLAFYTPLKGVY